MKQLLLLSGKGGTGKTTLATAFINLSKTRVYADCDVDAPNLHLLLTDDIPTITSEFIGLPKAVIHDDLCTNCGLCMEHCRFDAIDFSNNKYSVDEIACEGCGLCEAVCPVKAVTMRDDVAGELILFHKENYFSTAKLKMGSGTSGKLVSEVKKQLKEAPYDEPFSIVDGSPGIGCPVIASISGATMVLIVTEPSLSGISDMKRILDTAKIFGTKMAVCINKADLNPQNTLKIQHYCEEKNVPFVGNIPYDKKVVELLNQGRGIMSGNSEITRTIKKVYDQTVSLLLA